MRLTQPYPTLETLMSLMGDAGQRMAEIEATEGAAGNISIYIGWEVDPTPLFPLAEPFTLPTPVPELAGYGLLVTGSGRRLREILQEPTANLAFLKVDQGGRTGVLHTAPDRRFQKPTTEFNSHLAVHRDQVVQRNLNFHAILHAQPLHLVYLSHITRYQDMTYMNRHVLRWQPEGVIYMPEGMGLLPFMLPGSPELMLGTMKAMREHRMALWCKHGVIVRSDTSLKQACDLIEYAETGARYECLNLTNHGIAEGLSAHELRMICDSMEIDQKIF